MELTRPRVGCGVVLLSRNDSKVCISRRLSSHGIGRHALPGGYVEMFERFDQTASREIGEECGITIDSGRFILITVTEDLMRDDNRHSVTGFVCAVISQEEASSIRNMEPEKHSDWMWLSWAEIRALGPDGIFLPLRNFLNQGGDDSCMKLLQDFDGSTI
jgi:8-oxo-dGTP diphosphatase